MTIEEFWQLKAGDWIESIDGEIGMVQHFAARGVKKPFVRAQRRVGAALYVRVLPQGTCWHHEIVKWALPGLRAATLRKVVEKLEELEKLAGGK